MLGGAEGVVDGAGGGGGVEGFEVAGFVGVGEEGEFFVDDVADELGGGEVAALGGGEVAVVFGGGQDGALAGEHGVVQGDGVEGPAGGLGVFADGADLVVDAADGEDDGGVAVVDVLGAGALVDGVA